MDKLFEQTQVLNLDRISPEMIITATVDGVRLIMNKDQLFSRLGRRRRDAKKKVASKPAKAP